MNILLNKILEFVLLYFLKKGKTFFNDFEVINRLLILDEQKIKTDKDFNNYLVNLFIDISSQIKVDLGFYGLERRNKIHCVDLVQKIPTTFQHADYINKNFDEIFHDEVCIHRLKDDTHVNIRHIRVAFLAFRIGNEYFYIIEKKSLSYAEQYYKLLYSVLSKLIKMYKELRERRDLENRLLSMKNLITEKETALKIAERAVRRKAYDLHSLVEASNKIYSILNYKRLIDSALLTINGQIGVLSSFALMLDHSKKSYSRNFQKGFREREIQELRFKVDSKFARYFLKSNSPVYVNTLEKEAELERYVKKFKKLKIFVVAPIIHSERVQGIIGIGEKLDGSNFTQIDFDHFHVLINIISISIENVLHYEEVKNLSLTDGMTNLYNYRYFKIRLKEEINRAKRNKSKVSLLILDIDHFKNYNDTLGHPSGDEALRSLGEILKSTGRKEDIVSRYGGEEFCIILPGIAKKDMRPLGERIRKKIEIYKFYKEKVQPSGKLTISLGGATYPDDAKNDKELIQRADEALYTAKNMGRNQIRLYCNQKNDKKNEN